MKKLKSIENFKKTAEKKAKLFCIQNIKEGTLIKFFHFDRFTTDRFNPCLEKKIQSRKMEFLGFVSKIEELTNESFRFKCSSLAEVEKGFISIANFSVSTSCDNIFISKYSDLINGIMFFNKYQSIFI